MTSMSEGMNSEKGGQVRMTSMSEGMNNEIGDMLG